MTIRMKTKNSNGNREVHKPFLTGSPFDERTLSNGLKLFGTFILTFIVSLIVCLTSSGIDSLIIRMPINTAVILLALYIIYNSGAKTGTDDVARGEILYQKQEKNTAFSDSEKNMSFHPVKGYLIGLIGMLLFIVPAIILALNTSVQTTDSGTLPSWMQSYIKRSDIGNALINYTQPEGMSFIDYIRAAVRLVILPFVNIIGGNNKNGLLILERLSPLIMILPAAAYGTGYLSGRNIRTQIHTAISESDRKRKRIEKKKKKNSSFQPQPREPEKLN